MHGVSMFVANDKDDINCEKSKRNISSKDIISIIKVDIGYEVWYKLTVLNS